MAKRLVIPFVAALLGATSVAGPVSPALARPTCRGYFVTIMGTSGWDEIRGTKGRDVIAGLAGDDLIAGFGGDDIICGDGGNDEIAGLAGDDILDTGSGYGGGDFYQNLALGGGGADVVIGGEGVDVLAGNGGRDALFGNGGSDAAFGQDGADRLVGGGGADLLAGGKGDDRAFGGRGQDVASFWGPRLGVTASLATGRSGGQGRDRFQGVEGLEGSPVSDRLLGSRRTDVLFGSGGNDVLKGRGGPDVMSGDGGADRFLGGGGRDTASYFFTRWVTVDLARDTTDGAGDDSFRSIENLEAGLRSTLLGDRHPNTLLAPAATYAERLQGRGGKDRLFESGDSAESTFGGPGNDVIHAYGESVHGGPGDDRMFGSGAGDAGDDVMVASSAYGGKGNDVLIGGSDGDDLFGGPGDDVFHGGGGNDRFGHKYFGLTEESVSRSKVGLDVISYAGSRGAVVITFDGEPEATTEYTADRWTHDWFAFVGSRFDDQFVGRSDDPAGNDPRSVDVFWGWKGNDSLFGHDGADVLHGGPDEDSADGGLGIDRCPKVESASGCENVDVPEPPVPAALPAALMRAERSRSTTLRAAEIPSLHRNELVRIGFLRGGAARIARGQVR